MKTKLFTRTALAVSATLLGGIGAAYAANLAWYTGDNATVPDPDSVTTLKFYNASGTAITSGTIDGPIAAFAAADATVHSGDAYGTLFAYTPSSQTAPGAWTGAQLSKTTKFDGSGAESAPGAVSGKPFQKGASSDVSLADYIAGYPNTSTGPNLADIYELRLRTSSTGGFSADYASGFVKVSGNTWTQVPAPTLGDSGDAVDTTTTPGSKTVTYGTATSIPVTVTAAQGSAKPAGKVEFSKSGTKLGEAAVSGTTGIANVPVGKTTLKPGTHSLLFTFVPTNANSFAASQTTKSYTVAKAGVTPSWSFTTKPTATKAGKAKVTVKAASGLSTPTGKVEFQFRKLKSSKVTKSTGTLSKGAKTFTVAKKAKGTWEYRVKYVGSSLYNTKTTSWKKVKVTK